MDQDHRPETDDPIAGQPEDGQTHPGHGLFNAMLGKLKVAQGSAPADQGDVVPDSPSPAVDEPQPEPGSSEVASEAPVVERSEQKRPWWHMFAVKTPVQDMPEADAPVIDTQPAEQLDQQMEPHIPGTATADGVETEPSVFVDNDTLSAEPVFAGRQREQPQEKGAGFFGRIRQIKEQLFPPSARPAIAEEQYPGEPAHDAIAPEPEWNQGEPAADATPGDGIAPPAPQPVETAAAPAAEVAETAAEVMAAEVTDQAPGAAGPDAGEKNTALFDRLRFWRKRPMTESPQEIPEPAAAAAENIPDETIVEEQSAPAIPAPDIGYQPDQLDEPPVPSAAAPQVERITRARPAPIFYVREFFIAIGDVFKGMFAALRPRPRGPIDEVLAAKLEQRRQLDRDVRALKRNAAALARRLRRGRAERREALIARGRVTRELTAMMATMKARADDVQILERQGMALQGEIQQADIRHQQQIKDIDDSHLQWESLIQTIAQTKAQLDTVSVELGIKRNDAAHLDQMMEQRRRDLDAAVAETNRLEGVRHATEQAVQEFRAQIARLDQDRLEKQASASQATSEMERVKKLLDEHNHQRSVMESVLAQLQQDVATRQNLMRQLLDDGVRVKTETDQRLAQKEMLTSAIQDLTLEKEQLQQDMGRLRDEATALEQVHTAVTAQAGRSTSELQRLEAACQEREHRVADLAEKQEVHDLLVQKIGSMKDEGLALAKKLDELRSQRDLTEKALNSYRRELASVDTDIAQKKEERQRLGQQAKETEDRTLSLKRDLDLYVSQKSQLSDAIESSHQQLQSLEQQIAQKQDLRTTADQQLQQVREALSHAEGDHAQMQGAVAEHQQRLDTIAAQHQAFEQQLNAGRSEIAKLAQSGTELTAEIERNTAARASLIAQVQELKKIMAATSRENDMIQQQRRELESWIKEALPFRQQQQSAIEGQLAHVKQLQQQMAELNGQIAAGQARHAALSDDLAHLDQEKTIRSQSIEDELSRGNERLARTEAAIKDAEREMQQRSEQRRATVEALQKLEEERDLLKQEVSGLSQQSDKVKQLQAKADELAKMMAAGQKRLEEMFQENQTLTQDKAELQQAIKQADTEHNETRERQRAFAEEVQQVQHNLESLRQTRDQLQDDLSHQEGAHQALTAQVDAAQGELDERQRKLDAISEELRNVEAEISSKTISREQLDAAVAQLRQQHADMLAQVQAATGDVEAQKQLARQQLDSLNAELEKAKRSCADLDKSVKDKSAEENALLKRLKMLSTEAAQYQNMVKQRSELSRKIEEQKRVLEDLELQTEKKSGLFT